MSDGTQKEQWKQEAKQLKQDLESREKVVKKREVEIKFGKQKKRHSPAKLSPKTSDNSAEDTILRQSLGL
ncbi:hypothetical protein DID80_00295 [Candidatus Marinamargulisbacteria bacterium SCGC AAA071-K20]|nr:hypothetical protein DID80_00295 [Candidatus Marinamargulisbacteria bacterium SCGC AAA071-K20]